MEKVTLKQNQIDAIEYALTTERLAYYHNPDALLESHIRSRHFIDELEPLTSLKTTELARALYIGYEQCKEEKIKEYFDIFKSDGSDEDKFNNGYNVGVQHGVIETLRYLGIEIEGVEYK